jgi:hypothetical protein
MTAMSRAWLRRFARGLFPLARIVTLENYVRKPAPRRVIVDGVEVARGRDWHEVYGDMRRRYDASLKEQSA